MAEPQTAGYIEALIEGGVSGQVAFGNYNVQIVADHGAVVHVVPPEERPKPRPRPSPVVLRPRPFRGLLDRKEPADAAASALREGLPVEICGAPGIGKSALLRHLAYTVPLEGWPDGVVHLAADRQPPGDLLQALYEAFYESDVPFKPTEVQVRQFLQGRRALVLLDDLELDRQGIEELLNAAPVCAFLLISRERGLWGEGRALTMGGLPPEDALALYERGLERPLSPEERTSAIDLCTRLEGNPLGILQAAARARDGNQPTALPDEETRILSALAAIGGGPVGAVHLSALANVPDLNPGVQDLLQRRLVQAHSPRYSLTGDLAVEMAAGGDLEPWRERALTHFTAWAEENRSNPAAVLEESVTLRRLLDGALKSRRWEAALRLGRALEAALLLSGRWSAWAETLESVRQAAQALGDRSAGGWTLHQLGTRLLCLDDKAGARGLLTRALEIRESLGDRDGAAVTRHNLGLLGVPAPPSRKPGKGNLRFLPWAILPLLVLIGAAVWYARPSGTVQTETVPAPSVESPVLPTTDIPTITTDSPPPVEPPGPEVETSKPSDSGPPPAPELEVRPARLAFPETEIGGAARTQTVSLVNGGTAPLQIVAIDLLERDPDFSVESSCRETAVQPGGRCAVEIRFSPTRPGPHRDTLRIRAQGLEDRSLRIAGSVAEPKRAELSLRPEALSFGSQPVGTPGKAQTIEIVNRGNAPASLAGIDLRGEALRDFKLDGGCGGTEIQPGESCRLQAVFTPTAAGRRTAVAAVTDKTGGERLLTLSGEGVVIKTEWCCVDGKVFQTTRANCVEHKGTPFPSKGRADFACKVGQAVGTAGCCVAGTFEAGMTEQDCKVREGVFMTFLQATLGGCRKPRDPRQDQPPAKPEPETSNRPPLNHRVTLGWCCLGGSYFRSEQDACTSKQGFFTLKEEEAKNACAIR